MDKKHVLLNKTLVIGIITLILSIPVVPLTAIELNNDISTNDEIPLIPHKSGKTIYVDDDNTEGPWDGTIEHPFQTIRDGINNASDGDTVFVFNGRYNGSVRIDKSINLIGEDKYNTIIDGQYKTHELVKFSANSIYFSGFNIIHSNDWANDFGVAVYSSYNVVKDNIISDNGGGEGGLVLGGKYNNITNNIVKNNKRDYSQGILIGSGSHYNFVSENIIDNNYWGIWLSGNHDNVITRNHISNNIIDGIMIRGVGYNEVSNNIIEDNSRAAIEIDWDSSNVVVNGNIIKNNGKGLVIDEASSLIVMMNSFFVNGIQLLPRGLSYWISHSIYDNTINGKPIYYFKSEKDLVVPFDTGQLILVDCSNCIIKNLHISNVDYGIQLGFSNGNNIFSNEFYDNVRNCIRFYASSNNTIADNLIKNNLGTGIVISGGSSSNIIHSNFIENNKEYGVYLEASENNIHRNNFKKNKIGIYIDFSYDNLIFENNFIRNNKFPVSFTVDYRNQHKNKWKSNYYGLTFGLLPKLLRGSVKTRYSWEDPAGYKHYIYRPGFNFDWHPAKEPYDI